ncbi:MAG: C10 family peptidase [Bacteroidales bacterium]
MRKSGILLVLILILGMLSVRSAEIVKSQAEIAARNWFYERINQYQQVDYTDIVIDEVIPVYHNDLLTYYIVNFKDKGYVLLSSDDQLTPVIGYSFETRYSPDNQPPQLKYWMGEFEKEIVFHKENLTKATPEISSTWKRLLSEGPDQLQICKSKDVSPFLLSNWNQDKFYNELCPSDQGGDGGHVYVGCVATAMAQVMYYYRYPNQGFGVHSYTHPVYGLQTANFGTTTYGWDGMLNELSKANYPVALISYHAGVSINMDYGPDGSGAQTATAAQALKDYFRYANTTMYVQRMSYSLSSWYNLMRTNLDQKKPLMYSGYPSGGGAGHCWNCDGYQGTDYFHMNWGWGGASNGYYLITNLNPSAGGTNFNNGQGMVIGITPANNYPYHCSGQKVITDFTTGTLEDGSGPASYNSNNNCSYLLAPVDSVTALKINFNRLDTEAGSDVINIYGGSTTNDPLLGTYSGNTLPPQLTHAGNRLLITFESNDSIQEQGWFLTYSANYPTYCSNNTQTAMSGTISDGSGAKRYQSNTACQWIIQPSNAASVMLIFNAFETEPDDDFLKIYDLNTQELLATYSGNSIPPPVMSYTGAMFLQFKTDGSQNYQGWEATYTALGTGIEEELGFHNFIFYPNPLSDQLNVRFSSKQLQDINVKVLTLDGKTLIEEEKMQFTGDFFSTYNTSDFSKGVYMLRIQGNQGVVSKKIVVQ